MLGPRDEWPLVRGEHVARALAYALALALLPTAASFIMLQGSKLPLSPNAVPVTYFASLVALLALAISFSLLARMYAKHAPWQACVQLAVYGATPLALASALLVTPELIIVCVISLVHVFYLYYVGARILLGVPEKDAAQFVAVAFVIAFGASTLAGGVIGSLGLL